MSSNKTVPARSVLKTFRADHTRRARTLRRCLTPGTACGNTSGHRMSGRGNRGPKCTQKGRS
eukprot:8727104-Pyramimonas_sp.AAC.1